MLKINTAYKLTFPLLLFICFSWTKPGKYTKQFVFPYDTLKYDKVVAYDFNGEGEHPIVIDGQIQRSIIRNEKEINTSQITKIHKVLNDSNTYGGTTAFCFNPHLALVYYYKNKIVGNISICLECNYLESSMEIMASEAQKIYFCDTCSDFHFANGFSKTGRKRINDFCKELNFTHCQDSLNSDWFDK